MICSGSNKNGIMSENISLGYCKTSKKRFDILKEDTIFY